PPPPPSPPFPYTTLFRSAAPAANSTVSPLPAPLTMPVKTAPGSAISRLPLPVNDTAVPPDPMIVPALVRVLPPFAKLTPRPLGRSEEHTSELQSLAYLVC